VPPQGENAEALIQRGRAVFVKLGCDGCHTPLTYTSGKSYDVGLADEVGNRRFNPPSLRGVGQGGPYFHDGRAATLEEVLARYRHQLMEELAQPELEALLYFLRSL
jgi:cytochrome c peroxidase